MGSVPVAGEREVEPEKRWVVEAEAGLRGHTVPGWAPAGPATTARSARMPGRAWAALRMLVGQFQVIAVEHLSAAAFRRDHLQLVAPCGQEAAR